MKSIGRLFRLLPPYLIWAIPALIFLVIANGAQLFIPRLIQRAIDDGMAVGLWTVVAQSALLVVALSVGRAVFTFLQRYLIEKVAQGVAYDLRNTIFDKLQTLSFSYFDKARAGQLITRVTSDVDQIRLFFSQGILQLFTALVMIIGSAIILFTMNWRLAAAVFVVVLITGVVIVFLFSLIRPLFAEVQKRLGRLNNTLQENLAGIRVVKAFAREPYEAGRFADANLSYRDKNYDVIKSLASVFPIIFLLANIGTLVVIWVGGSMVISEQLSIGELLAFNTYLTLLLLPLFILGFISTLISRAAASADRIFEVIDAEIDVKDKPNAPDLPLVDGRVVFEDVTFRYAGGETKALDNVSFTAEPGETIAILGQTGSGKTTVINMIPRFYDVNEGRILIDGHDIRDVTLDSLRSQIGLVLQETLLFSGTLSSNIAYGNPDATQAEIIAAAKAAQAHDFIAELEHGYDTEVGERGAGLSGGQRQRIAIARALLINPKLLILDDSTSAVDTQTEYLIQQALTKLMEGRTSIVIAQRISTVRAADKIIVLEQGEVAAMGTHDDLLATSALYGEIVDSQLIEDTREVPNG